MRTLATVALTSLALAAPAAAGQHQHPAAPHQHAAGGGHEQLGTVDFVTSCSAAAKPDYDRAVALLHSFEFGDAITGFTAALAKDPTCAMAEWGIAMSRWGNPFGAAQRAAKPLEAGAAAVARGKALGPKTPREQAYLDAVGALFADAATVDQRTRFTAYRDAMASLAAAHPTDPEARIFHALSVAGSHVPSDKSYARLLEAGAILEGLIDTIRSTPACRTTSSTATTCRRWPTAGSPPPAATRRFAPSAPHALHSRRIRSRGSARGRNRRTQRRLGRRGPEAGSTAESCTRWTTRPTPPADRPGRGRADAGRGAAPIKARFDPTPSAAPRPARRSLRPGRDSARYALERGDWKAAAALAAEQTMFLFPDAQTWFAKALGAARSGDAAGTTAAIAELTRIRDALTAKKEAYWAEQVEIQRRTGTAWLALVEGRASEALLEMMAAADAEDRTEKAAVTPGPLAPARELLGEMLLQMEKPTAALQAFEATLKKEPNRFRALSGAFGRRHCRPGRSGPRACADAADGLRKATRRPGRSAAAKKLWRAPRVSPRATARSAGSSRCGR